MGILRKKITEKDVVNYLLENSDFFIKNPQALEALEIKHESGDAVSLIERQVELIKEKSNKTVSKLKELLSNAHLNETLFIKVKDLVKIILKSRQLEDLSSSTENFFKNEFETDACKVIFFTQEDLFKIEPKRIILPEIATQIFSNIFREKEIFLGALNNELSTIVFGAKAEIQEGAICKIKSEKVAGILALGARTEEKYSKDKDTLFLSFVLDVLSYQIDKIIEDRN